MSALDQLMQLRGPFEEAIRQMFADMDIAAITRANAPKEFQQATPRVEIVLSIGAANRHRFICPDGVVRFDRWRMTLGIQCVTRPANNDQAANDVTGTVAVPGNQLHEAFVGRIRNICSSLAQTTWTDLDHFPNHRIAEPLLDVSANSVSKIQDGLEYTLLNWSGTACVRETAWPLAA